MPYKVLVRTIFPSEYDGGTRREMGYEELPLYFHDKANAHETAEINTSAIRSCQVCYVEDAPGPFQDEPPA